MSAGDIAGFVDGQLPADRRAAAEAHLAACSDCRAELVAASQLVDSAPARSHMRRHWYGIAAAGIVLFAAVAVLRSRGSTEVANERSTPADLAGIRTIGPTEGMTAAKDSLSFVWRPVPGATRYHLFVTDSLGSPVYDRTTSDTLVGPISGAPVAPGSRYFWHVDALTDDGSSVASRQIGFSIRSP